MADQQNDNAMSQAEKQQMLLMLQDLGGQRRTNIAECDAPTRGNATPVRIPSTRDATSSARRAPHSWGNIAGSEDDNAATHHSGNLHRQRKESNYQDADEHVDEERSRYLDNKRSTTHMVGNKAAINRPHKTPAISRQRAPSPRAAGTVRIVHGQRVEVPGTQPATTMNGTASKAQSQKAVPKAPRALNQGNGTPSARSFARSIAAVSAQPSPRKATPAAPRAVARISNTPHVHPASNVSLPQPPVSTQPVVTSASPTKVKEATQQASAAVQATQPSSREDKMLDLALKQYIAKDMSFPQLREILKQIFDPARAQWLHKHKDLLQAFDQVGQAFRCLIMQICEQDCASVKSFLRDFGFVPQIKEHVNAASQALYDASHGNAAYYEHKLQYLPFFKMAQRMLQEHKIQPLIDIEADLTYTLLEEMDKNSQAWLSQSPMPAGLVLRNGIYYQA